MRTRILLGALALVGTAVAACGSATAPRAPASGAVFVVDVVGERFRVLVRDSGTLAQARRMVAGTENQKIVTGELTAGTGGFNTGWSWHLTPGTVAFAEITIELCDGRPSLVEANLAYWLGTVRRYCPWHGRIVAEEPVPNGS